MHLADIQHTIIEEVERVLKGEALSKNHIHFPNANVHL